ncbi:hypothetical protein AB0395_41160 [Streptosporangium sp. NPDC051023]|uniref:hypothetical protein n=1 Tax=Streptosporangium sp. NPDC051023 TaxID=3155410 RepID=UPI00344E556D
MEHGLIYHSEASYSFQHGPETRADADDVHPMWGIHLHYPDRRTDTDPGDHIAILPHARLESMAARFGFDPDEADVIVDTLLHLRVPSPDDPLAWQDPGAVAVMQTIADLPDPGDPRLPYETRREVLLAHAAAVREHAYTLTPASLQDRQGAVAARVFDLAAQAEALGVQIPNLDIAVPDTPLAAILAVRLDPSRVAARRARDEWLLQRTDSAQRAAAAKTGPRVFGFAP